MLIDTHCHLDDDLLFADADNIVSQFEKCNIEKVIDAGSSFASSVKAVELANKYEKVYATVGIHPEEAGEYSTKVEDFIIESVKNSKVVAIGEIGLDYYYEVVDRTLQQKVFQTQIELANHLKMPIVVHLRDAYQDMYNILNDNKSKLAYGVVIHCYSGSEEMLKQFNKFDCFYSVGGAITFKNYSKIDMLKALPIDRVMLETDSPYLTPVPFRGKVNTPLNVGFVAKKLAEVKQLLEQEIIDITNKNAKIIYSRIG